MKRQARLAFLTLLPAMALAQVPRPPMVAGEPETVTSEADRGKFDHTVHEFVQSLAAPALFSEKVTQWNPHIPLCPKTASPSEELNRFVTKRIREVAAMVGAPLAKSLRCSTNMMVVFTDNPQALLDDVQQTVPRILGYVTTAKRKQAATVDHAIQAWYRTVTEDALGNIIPDNADAEWMKVMASGNRLRDGVRSELASVLVVVDTGKAVGQRREAVADYAALLALTQTRAFDDCRGLPSIANLLAKACDAALKTDSLSEYDVAYLKALYRMDPDRVLLLQTSGIARSMAAALNNK